jgi:hypothetical protein
MSSSPIPSKDHAPAGGGLSHCWSRRRLLGALAGGLVVAPAGRLRADAGVDLLLVLAVDASGSVNQTRFELQRSGYADAFRNPQVLRAIQSGLQQSIAISMVQWTGPRLHVESVPWMVIKDAASAEAAAKAIEASPRRLYGGGTSLSGAIDYGVTMFEKSPVSAPRRVIDVSGDGSNNAGRSPTVARDAAVAQGVTINGLPILSLETDLDDYYRDHVIGGEGAFLVSAKSFEDFGEAIIKKLIAEIASND